jgi:hypothetical protein
MLVEVHHRQESGERLCSILSVLVSWRRTSIRTGMKCVKMKIIYTIASQIGIQVRTNS